MQEHQENQITVQTWITITKDILHLFNSALILPLQFEFLFSTMTVFEVSFLLRRCMVYYMLLKCHNHGNHSSEWLWKWELLKYVDNHSKSYWCCLLGKVLLFTQGALHKKGDRWDDVFSERNTRLKGEFTPKSKIHIIPLTFSISLGVSCLVLEIWAMEISSFSQI